MKLVAHACEMWQSGTKSNTKFSSNLSLSLCNYGAREKSWKTKPLTYTEYCACTVIYLFLLKEQSQYPPTLYANVELYEQSGILPF